ncbi:MAG: hypothetical protein LBD24_00955, partial [Spirochaetaceae bacterium]|nr:hypothetical protein [Spirochaetaceae bacterium]
MAQSGTLMCHPPPAGGGCETAGGRRRRAAPGPCKPAHRTGCCTNLKHQAAMFEAVGDGPEAGRAGRRGRGLVYLGN